MRETRGSRAANRARYAKAPFILPRIYNSIRVVVPKQQSSGGVWAIFS